MVKGKLPRAAIDDFMDGCRGYFTNWNDIILTIHPKESIVSDARVDRFAQVLIDYSTRIKPGDRVLIEATTAAEPLVRALYTHILEVGGNPQVLLEFPEEQEIFMSLAGDAQLDYIPPFRKLAYETFESRIRIMSQTNPRALGEVDPARLNVNGGSIALGHPFAATGARMLLQTAREMVRRKAGHALLTVCAAGALGAAVVLDGPET